MPKGTWPGAGAPAQVPSSPGFHHLPEKAERERKRNIEQLVRPSILSLPVYAQHVGSGSILNSRFKIEIEKQDRNVF